MAKPLSDHDWTIHALNIHGTFFERWCQNIVVNCEGWQLRAVNYPVAFPQDASQGLPRESALDIRAEFRIGENIISGVIECKKNNPAFIDWVFFPKFPEEHPVAWHVPALFNHVLNPENNSWQPESMIARGIWGVPRVMNDARETKGSYAGLKAGDKTKTTNAAINEAAHQVSLATQSLVAEQLRFGWALRGIKALPPYQRQLFVPMIVTTANLKVAEFANSAISPLTGEIDFEQVTLRDTGFIYYEYPLPAHLQAAPTETGKIVQEGRYEQYVRMRILVVNSQHFESILRELSVKMAQLFPE